MEKVIANAENTITIDRLVTRVYNFVLEGENNRSWSPMFLDVQHLAGKPGSNRA